MAVSRLRAAVVFALLLVTGASLWLVLARVSASLAPSAATLPAGEAATRPDEAPTPRSAVRVRLEPLDGAYRHPLFVTHAGDGSGRLFVVEQTGGIRIVKDGRLAAEPFLDLAAEIDTASGERGLLGLAFAPDYATSGQFFVSHTAQGKVVVARYRANAPRDLANPRSRTVILDMDDPAGNHNGGMLAFGPDGNLWIGTGDGGRGGDPWNNAQNPRSLLGKMLRLDVRGETYAVPSDNPFVADRSAVPEVWALGLRNPWRYSFDRETGELWIGDVGQNSWEEIDVVAAKAAGKNFGWRTMEGFHCYEPRQSCNSSGLTPPVHAYGRAAGCSVTGGYVYRGRAMPGLAGAYLFGDYCTGRIWTLRREPSGHAEVELLLESGLSISSFGEDEAGELYVCDHQGGRVLRLDPSG